MAKVIINRFDGGNAEDILTKATNECELSYGFDIFKSKDKLIKLYSQIQETTNSVPMYDVGLTTIAGTDYLVGVGENTTVSARLAFYTRASTSVNGSFTSQQALSAYNIAGGTYIEYGGVAYAMTATGAAPTTYRLESFTAAGVTTVVGSFTDTSTYTYHPRPFIHPDDKILYMCIGTTIAKYNLATTTFSSHTGILPTGYKVVSVTNFGGYLAIAMNPLLAGQQSLLLLWGRDTSITTLQASINCGTRAITCIENLNGELVLVFVPENSSFIVDKYIDIKVYRGGDYLDSIKSILVPSAYVTNPTLAKAKYRDRLYFGCGGYPALHSVGKNSTGQYTISTMNMIYDGSIGAVANAISSVSNISFVNDICYIAFRTTGGSFILTASDVTTSIARYNNAVYRTSQNMGMNIADRSDLKVVKSVKVIYKCYNASGNTTTLSYSVDGSTDVVLSVNTNVSGQNIINVYSDTTGGNIKVGRYFTFQIDAVNNVEIEEIQYEYDTISEN